MKPLVPALLLLTAAGCLSTVDERWCGPQLPCSQGFVCTTNFHCVRTSGPDDGGTGGGGGGRVDGGSGGGTGGGGGGLGGGAGGGTGGGLGGGGGRACDAVSCSSGCCLGNNCVPVMAQGNSVCGSSGDVCRSCSFSEGCVGGRCLPVIGQDAGSPSPIGGACAQDFDCGTTGVEFCIPEFSGGQPTGFVGGYCSRMCEDEPCPSNAACVQAETGGGDIVNICLATCFGNSCRMGYQCDSQGSQGVCLP